MGILEVYDVNGEAVWFKTVNQSREIVQTVSDVI